MRRVLPVTVASFVIVILSSYTLLWFYQARLIRKGVERQIAALNSVAPSFQYDTIETTGYPRDVLVSVTNPRFSGRIDPLIAPLLPAGRAPESVAAWQETIALNGSITFGIDALSNHYTASIRGNWTTASDIGGRKIALESAGGDSICSLTLKTTHGWVDRMWDYEVLYDKEKFADHFRSLNCAFAPYAVTDPATRQPLLASGGGQIFITSEPQPGELHARLYIQSRDMEVSTAGDMALLPYFQWFNPRSAPVKLSAFGKQNVEIDLSYNGPENIERYGQTGEATPLEIRIDKLLMSNAIYNTNARFLMANKVEADKRLLKLSWQGTSAFGEGYGLLLQDNIRQIIEGFYRGEGTPDSMAPLINRYTASQLHELVRPLVPDLHGLGTITHAIELAYEGDKSFTSGNATLASLEFSAAPYGLSGSGSGQWSATRPLPVAKAMLQCADCPAMIDDMERYAGRIRQAALTIDPEAPYAGFFLPWAGIKQFLTLLGQSSADASGKRVLRYDVNSDGQNLTVNGKTLMEIMALYNESLGAAPIAPITP